MIVFIARVTNLETFFLNSLAPGACIGAIWVGVACFAKGTYVKDTGIKDTSIEVIVTKGIINDNWAYISFYVCTEFCV